MTDIPPVLDREKTFESRLCECLFEATCARREKNYLPEGPGRSGRRQFLPHRSLSSPPLSQRIIATREDLHESAKVVSDAAAVISSKPEGKSALRRKEQMCRALRELLKRAPAKKGLVPLVKSTGPKRVLSCLQRGKGKYDETGATSMEIIEPARREARTHLRSEKSRTSKKSLWDEAGVVRAVAWKSESAPRASGWPC